MSGKAWFGVVFAAVVIAAAAGQDQPRPGVTPLGPDPSAVPAVLDAAGHSVLVWVGFIAAGFVAGVVYALVSGTLADRYPSRKWPIWGGLAGGSVGVWVLVGQAASWFNTVTGGLVMVTTVLVMDLALGGRRFTPPARKVPVPDESWRDVIPQSVVLGNTEALPEPRTPTWRDLQKMSWEVQQGVSVVALARSWKVEPDEIVRMVRDFRLAEDRWEDTLNGRTPTTTAPIGRDLSEEIRDTGWDAFLAATPMRLIHRAPDPGHPGADAVLFEITAGPWVGQRVLQVIDASPEDGINARVGIPVGRDHIDAGRALADTWGLDPEKYQPLRHT